MKVIAFVDGSAYSASVCDHAAWAATQMTASLDLFHLLGRRSPGKQPADLSGNLKLGARTDLLEKLAKADEEWAQLAQARGWSVLEDASERIRKILPDAEINCRLRHDDMVEALSTFEADANLIVIGKRGEASGFARDHLGSNLERTLRSAKKPVLVANYEYQPVQSCLIAYDGGPSIRKALRLIAHGALLKDITCHLLSVSKDTSEMRAELEGVSAMLQKAGLQTSIDIRAGAPEYVVPEAATEKNSNLLVMGAYGHSRIRNLIIGSTTTSVVRSCKLPVLMFR